MRPLTQKQRAVLFVMLTGTTDKEAAARLGISHRVVERQLLSMRRRYKARNTNHLLVKVWESGLKPEVHA